MRALLLIALLAGCSVPSQTDTSKNTTANPAGEHVATTPGSPATPQPAAAKAIHRAEQTERIDYELTIPAEAAALLRLTSMLIGDAEKAKAETLDQQAEYAKEFPESGAQTFGLRHNWEVVGRTDRLLSLIGSISGFSGGAHGSAGTTPLLWDRANDRVVTFDDLFTDRARALATIRSAWCKGLTQARIEKTGMADTGFTACPPFSELTVAPSGNVGGRFSRITVTADPYVAGSWAEGDYSVDLFIPKAMIPFIAPEWRASFPG